MFWWNSSSLQKNLENYITVLDSKSSLVLWFVVSKRLTGNDDILCGIVYIPPYGTRYSVEDPFFEIENELRSLSENYNYIAMFGDYNSRTKNLSDRIMIDSFLFEHLNCDDV